MRLFMDKYLILAWVHCKWTFASLTKDICVGMGMGTEIRLPHWQRSCS